MNNIVYSEQLISVFNGFKEAKPFADMTFMDFISLGDKYRNQIEKLRGATTKEERDRLKALLPAATIAGTFHPTRKNDSLQQPSHLMCLDIDAKENPWCSDWDALKDWLCDGDEHIFYAGRSVSGNGLFLVYAIEYKETFADQYTQLERTFAARGITIDKSCKNVSRLRVLSYDERPYFNEFAVPFQSNSNFKLLTSPHHPIQVKAVAQHRASEASVQPHRQSAGSWQGSTRPDRQRASNGTQTLTDRVERCCSLISQTGIDITSSYDDWMKVGMALASLGTEGREFYHICSSQNPEYSVEETDRKFDDFISNGRSIGIGTFFHICQDYGITYKQG